MSDDPEDRDLMAASYVLGVLDPDEARDVEMLAHEDHAVATSLDKWRNHLAPLAEAVPPVPPPPAVWERIEATLRMAPARAAAGARSGASPGCHGRQRADASRPGLAERPILAGEHRGRSGARRRIRRSRLYRPTACA